MVAPFNHRLSLIALIELLLAAAVFSAAFLLVVSTNHQSLHSLTPTMVAAQFAFALSLLLPAGACGLHRLGRGEALRSFAFKFLVSMALGAALCYAAFALFPPIAPYQALIPDAVVVGALGLMAVRLLCSSGVQSNAFTHRILVVGTGTEAASVERALRSLSTRGMNVVGFYQIDSTPPVVPRERVIACTQPLETVIRLLQIHEIVVAVRDQRDGALPLQGLLNCRLEGIPVTPVSSVFERALWAVPLESLKVSWLIYGKGFRQRWSRRTVKRAFDLIAATALLVVAAPIMLVAALGILLESGPPIIFRQERVGLRGRKFLLLKFRSMCVDAELDGVPRWAAQDDPRVTRVGRLIRRMRIDELPQVFNILRGDMSFVGPRPERAFFVQQLAKTVPFYGLRHSVKPGLTGWAQVHYSYGASVGDAVRKLEYDLYYVKNHSLLLDLIVLLLTVRVVALGKGAR
jgi:sugar transferase (PEP-CTERM system associated)